MRLLGLRRVDVRSHGPVNIQSAVVASVVDTITTQAGRALNQPSVERYRARQVAAAQEVTRIREADSGADPEAIAEQTMDVYRRHNVGCGPLAWRTPTHFAAVRLPALRSGRRQTLTERLAGTVVIRDR
jgi:hypothetical protein